MEASPTIRISNGTGEGANAPSVHLSTTGRTSDAGVVELDPIAQAIVSQAGGLSAEELTDLALSALQECRDELALRFRFLNTALWHMPVKSEKEIYSLLTNGVVLRFGPMAFAQKYRFSPDEAVRDLLHLTLHCLFRHPFEDRFDDPVAYSIACDIMVESIAVNLCDSQFSSSLDRRRRKLIDTVKDHCPLFTPQKLYRYLTEEVGDERMAELSELFRRDSHIEWKCMQFDDYFDPTKQTKDSGTPRPTPAPAQTGQLSADADDDTFTRAQSRSVDADERNAEDEPSETDETERDDELDEDEQPQTDPADDADDQDAVEPDDELEKARSAWETIAKQVEIDLRTRQDSWGSSTGWLVESLSVVNRKHYDYAAFLRLFSAIGEDIKINDDEFDYVYYTFGLRRYGNMPLVEPLEYREENRIREFVIALDTSGSCSGDLIRMFVQRTYDILKQSEHFGDRINVHIIQCDAAIKSDTKISSLDDLDEYLQDFTVIGYGGTNFRPVFDYVGSLLDQGEFRDLRGLIYFTDGRGTYPTYMPPYDTAFVFVNDEITDVKVPPWAMKVILDEDDIRHMDTRTADKANDMMKGLKE